MPNNALTTDLPILHHYDASPFGEKIRLAFGLKGARWRSVIAPAVMPKPELVALTGGYRHIPVLQMGADVYCDTRTIARELDRRFDANPLMSERTRGLATAVEAWAERDLFWPIARYASGINAETLGPGFHADRANLRGKTEPTVDRLLEVARRSAGLVRAELAVVEQMLADGRSWLLADAPGQADLAVYHALWFLGSFKIDCSHELSPYPMVRAWMVRVAGIGHGHREEISATDALAEATAATPVHLPTPDRDDSLPSVGCKVAVRPEDYVTAAVEGELVHYDRHDVAVLRSHDKLGNVMVHLPRIGYSVKSI